jgi:hypothetical protein
MQSHTITTIQNAYFASPQSVRIPWRLERV